MKNLLVLGNYDFSAIGYHLSEAVNRHAKGWNSRSIITSCHPFRWNTDIVVSMQNKDEVNRLIDEADFILLSSSSYWYNPTSHKYPVMTPRGLWHGGTFYRNNFLEANDRIHPFFDFVFAHRDLASLGDIIPLQAPFPTHLYPAPEKDFPGKIFIGHNPSRQDIKGTDRFLDAMGALKAEHDIEYRVIDGCDFRESMKAKASLHFFFDQIADYFIPEQQKGRGYGTALVEAATYGAVCLSDCDWEDTPIVTVRSAEDIYDRMNELLADRGQLNKKSADTRKWVERTHGYKRIASDFISVIDGYISEQKHIIINHLLKKELVK